jgi:HAMP domain-containing protein
MLQNHRDEVYHIITTLGAGQGIKKIRIFNKEGRISFSTDAAEVNTLVNKGAEACYACHAQEQPLAQLNRPDRMRTYTGPGQERILGLINPIENERSCSEASCHAHPPEQRVLGVLDVTLSLAGVDQAIAEGQRSMLANFIAAILLISTVFAWLIWIMIHKPVNKLIRGTNQVAAGKLDHKIEIDSADEIGELAYSFNRMTGELRFANEELTDWAKKLESRVDQKTQ